ncbi:MAG: TonB-dependent receptor plug domain-containing protein [Candidatus Sulfotelmatobacter sp.]
MATTLCLLLVVGLVKECRADGLSDEQEPKGLKQLSLEQLGDTEVMTVSKQPVKIARTPAAIYVLTQDDIQRSGATSIPEALRLVPGVEVSRIDSNTWAVGVRGFESSLSRSVLVLIDGRSVYTPLYAGVYWDVQDTLLKDIDRIEVIRGPGGTIWGPNAVNGVINIITKNAKDTQGAMVSAGGGNVDQGTVGARYGSGNGRNFNYRIYGKGFARGPEFHPDQDEFDSWRMGQGGFRADWDAHTRDTFTLQGDVYGGSAGERVNITTYSQPFVATSQSNANLSGGNLVGHWERSFNNGSGIQLEAYYDRTNRHSAEYGETRNTFDIDFLHHLTLPWRQAFVWGLGGRVSPSDFIQVVPTLLFAPHSTNQLYSAFLQDEITLVDNRLWLTIGSKFLHNNYTGFDIQPTVRLLWNPSPQQTIWAAVTRAVRTPSAIEEDFQDTGLISANPLLVDRIYGDGHFSAERLIGYEAGYRAPVTPKLYLDVASFYNDYTHLESLEPGATFLETSPAPSHLVLPFFFRNGLLGDTSGIEIGPDWKPTQWWRLEGSYSYLHMALRNAPGSLDSFTAVSTEGSSPAHEVMIQSFLELPRSFALNQTYRYVSALPAQGVASYWTGNVQLGWHSPRGIGLSLVGQNLLQPHHAEFGGDPGPLVGNKRGIYAQITWRSTEK